MFASHATPSQEPSEKEPLTLRQMFRPRLAADFVAPLKRTRRKSENHHPGRPAANQPREDGEDQLELGPTGRPLPYFLSADVRHGDAADTDTAAPAEAAAAPSGGGPLLSTGAAAAAAPAPPRLCEARRTGSATSDPPPQPGPGPRCPPRRASSLQQAAAVRSALPPPPAEAGTLVPLLNARVLGPLAGGGGALSQREVDLCSEEYAGKVVELALVRVDLGAAAPHHGRMVTAKKEDEGAAAAEEEDSAAGALARVSARDPPPTVWRVVRVREGCPFPSGERTVAAVMRDWVEMNTAARQSGHQQQPTPHPHVVRHHHRSLGGAA